MNLISLVRWRIVIALILLLPGFRVAAVGQDLPTPTPGSGAPRNPAVALEPDVAPPGVRAPEAESVPPLVATLFVVEADWSRSPTAQQVEADLREAFQDLKLTPEQQKDILRAAPQILLARGLVPLYTPSHASSLLVWLKTHGLLKTTLSSTVQKYILHPGATDPYGNSPDSSQQAESAGTHSIRHLLQILDQDNVLHLARDVDNRLGPFVTRSQVPQWLIHRESLRDRDAIALRFSTVLFEQRRGEEFPRNLGEPRIQEAFMELPDGLTAMVGATTIFDPFRDESLAAAPAVFSYTDDLDPQRPAIGILLIGRSAPELDGSLAPRFTVPDRIGTVRHQRVQPVADRPLPTLDNASTSGEASKPDTPAARTVPAQAEANVWQQSELARLAGTWQVVEVVIPLEGTPSPDDRFELRVLVDRFVLLVNGQEKGHGVVALDNVPGGPRFQFVFLKDHITPTGGHLGGTYQFQPDGTLWLTTPDTSIRPREGTQPDKILKLGRAPDPAIRSTKQRPGAESRTTVDSPADAVGMSTAAPNELKNQYDALERTVLELASRVRAAPAGDPETPKRKAQLQSAVIRAFDLRQQLHRAELQAFEERIARSRLAIETREENRNLIVARRVQDLVDPNLTWDDPSTTMDSTNTPRRSDRRNAPAPAAGVLPEPKPPARTQRERIEDEYRRFESEWRIISEEEGGKTVASPAGTPIVVIKNERVDGARFLLDIAPTPRHIDLSTEVAPGLVTNLPGIYEWVLPDAGTDRATPERLRIRFPLPGSPGQTIRPVDFVQGGNFRTLLLERIPAARKPAPVSKIDTLPIDPDSEYNRLDGRWRLIESSKAGDVHATFRSPDRIFWFKDRTMGGVPIVLDPSHTPRQIDFTVRFGETSKPGSIRGIYQWEEPVVEGQPRRRLRLATKFPRSDRRPENFQPAVDVETVLLEWVGENEEETDS